MFIYILLKGTLVIIRKATGQKKKKTKNLTVYKCSMDGKGIVYAKAYFIFCGIHGNNFVILRISETKISHCLMLIISLTCNNSLFIYEKNLRLELSLRQITY